MQADSGRRADSRNAMPGGAINKRGAGVPTRSNLLESGGVIGTSLRVGTLAPRADTSELRRARGDPPIVFTVVLDDGCSSI